MEYSLTTGFDVTDVNFLRTFDQSGEEPFHLGFLIMMEQNFML